MAIIYDETERIFHLQTHSTSYAFQIMESGHLAHLYWGQRLRTSALGHRLRLVGRAFSPEFHDAHEGQRFGFDTVPLEYPTYGNTDFREPAVQVRLNNGSRISDFRYQSHRILDGKPKLQGLPATYADAGDDVHTLEIDLVDEVSGLRLTLCYSAFTSYDAITRSVRYSNEGTEALTLMRTMSMNVDFQDDEYEMMNLAGSWGRERYIERRPLVPGTQSIESRRGASSHQQNPFIALLRKGTTEEFGSVYGVNLVYSGSFRAFCEVDQYHTTRVSMGINPFDFSWLLEPGSSFQTPEVVMVYSGNGLGSMSRIYHRLYRDRLMRGQFRDAVRPVLINNWEATYFDFNEDLLLDIAKTASELGVELFVLDDGWFGRRNDDKSSLGDWVVDKEKLPNGLGSLAKSVNQQGMKFGLWFEPEMVSPDSDLYRAHADWCLHVPHRNRSESRNQLVLDLSREDVCDYIVTMISSVLSSANIEYVKWDMNRHMTEIGSALLPPERQAETAHRYMLGLYSVLDRITSAFPHVLFESCSGGGGRFDPGMLYFMPQTWTSDNTDAVSRLKIQYGTSVAYPAISMGAHVSAVPNHQVHRITPLETRGHIAMGGNFGYELNLAVLSDEEKALVREQVAFYKEVRHIVQHGDFYRLVSPFEGNDTAWMFVSRDKTEALVTYCRVLSEPHPPLKTLCLAGLDAAKDYRFISGPELVGGGDELMFAGLQVPYLAGDYRSAMWRLKSE